MTISDISLNDFYLTLPLIILSVGILISLVIEMYSKSSERILPWFSVFLFFGVSYYSLFTIANDTTAFLSSVKVGGSTHIFYFLFAFAGAIVTLFSKDYIKKTGIYFGEYYIILQSAVLGMMMIASASDLVMVFIGLEQMSICFYILAGFQRKRSSSNEASLKYFLLGSFATGFIVYGMALIYGATGSLNFAAFEQNFTALSTNILFLIGTVLFLMGFSFKIAAFPFHMWVPDVYQGSPTTVTAFMSTAGKVAGFTGLIVALMPFINSMSMQTLSPYLAGISALSMIYGSIVAISQKDIKRMLAYSSISHAGYMLIGLAAGNDTGLSGVIFYLAAYTFMNLGAFGIIALIEGENEENLTIDDYNGLGTKAPILGALLSVFMFALSGIPPFAGFFGKYYVFYAAVEANMVWLALIGVLSSVISVYFYLRVVVVMYFGNARKNIFIESSGTTMLGVFISFLLVVLLGIMPDAIIQMVKNFFV